MDWTNVTTEELVDAMRQVDWKARPRPFAEMFRNFTYPRTSKRWRSRVKCNVYYYRSNYFWVCVLCYLASFYRNPLSLLALALGCAALLSTNDNFATLADDRLMRAVRKASPSLAVKLRSLARGGSSAGGTLGSPRSPLGDKHLYICGLRRSRVVLVLLLAALWMTYASGAVASLLWASLHSLVAVSAHASLRTHNLKAKMASAREDFRAVWRGYNTTDYTL